MVPLFVCWSDTRNEIQREMVLPNLQESSVRGSPKLVTVLWQQMAPMITRGMVFPHHAGFFSMKFLKFVIGYQMVTCAT